MIDLQFQPVDLSRQDHSAFIYDLLDACRDEMLDDYASDIITLMEQANQLLQVGRMMAKLAYLDGVPVGAIWCNDDRNDIARIHGGLMPEYRMGWLAVRIFRDFLKAAFKHQNIRKIEATLPIDCLAAEGVLLWCGFQKEGIIREAFTLERIPHSCVLLGLTRNDFYRGAKYGQRRRSRARRIKRSG